MSTAVIDILMECREQLQECASPLGIEKYREDISKECNVAVTLLKELKEAEEREIELDQKCIAVKDLPNKMEYSNVVKEMSVVKKCKSDLSNQINHAIRNHDVVVNNKKRVKIEIDRLDDILLIAQLELSEYGDTPSLRAETQDYLPLQITRAKALAKMRTTRQSLEEVRETLQREKLEHRDSIYDLKTEIKTTRADINAMENGTYAPAVEFMAKLSERRKSQTSELDNKRRMLDDEIEEQQTSIAKDTLVHDANASALQAEKMELEQKLADMAKNNASSIQDAESALAKLKEEQSENSVMLLQLEKRLADEQEEGRLRKEEEDKRLQEVLEKKSMEEKEYYAALWIQLRWKTYLKRKALKQSSKGKKGKKGKKAKKK
mmetsp:Transcript_15120/g.24587  ORF Transcript_15120/g.24587 Transcript_15120/m.24587 type:complete len:378 (-) Transcript_15120:1116-2249(-)|eukprot:CAMPEP_0201968064 /NCGR_PEP_ID=MMETSP0904-20121228/12569_1 /ASSEMBLY_ACC=CAM_ASM_000553 /TAXON_ID=420261 /ORGANISM="Thalassiosira antarctica, Strain CCMP982" /LENGTH=377 /DNA_ID=CAMNT_0048515663 /DNA_START=211 /DNA_END=1344 /DNA_ORIENTATION=-